MNTMQDLEALTTRIVELHQQLDNRNLGTSDNEHNQLMMMESQEIEMITELFDEAPIAIENTAKFHAMNVHNDWVDDHFNIEGELIYADSEDRFYGWKNGSKLRVLEVYMNADPAKSTVYCTCIDDDAHEVGSWSMLSSIKLTKVEAK